MRPTNYDRTIFWEGSYEGAQGERRRHLILARYAAEE